MKSPMTPTDSSTSQRTGHGQTTLKYGNSEVAVRSAWMPRQFAAWRAGERDGASYQDESEPEVNVRRRRKLRDYSLGEEIANSITHGIGAALAVAAIVLCIVVSVRDGGGLLLLSALVYSISMLLEYLMSTLYHAIPADGAKRVFKVLDHGCIYLFIAGSYTPFCLVTLAGAGGMKLGLFVWVVAAAGMAVEAFWVYRPRWISAIIYLLLGWAVVWFIPLLAQLLPPVGFALLLVGGICYTVGCVFYVLKKIPYMHTVFHVLILAGSVFQFFTILLFVL